jgi:pimeloyl-ACP methyl ester carboxylesterase
MNKTPILPLIALGLAHLAALHAADATDSFTKYLDGKAPAITREIAPVPADITLRRVLFRIRDKNEAYAVIATPKTPGKHPGILVLHGSGGNAEEEKAMAWAQRGYIAVAPDMPGLYSPLTHGDLPMSKGYADGRYSMQPDTTKSVIFDGMLAAMKALDLLRAQPDVDTANIGVVGVSWGGTMTTMVCGLAGDKVKAGFAIYGCGFFDKGNWLGGKPSPTAKPGSLAQNMTAEERERWLRDLDPGRRVPNMKAAFFHAGAANDFFGWPDAVQATYDAIPSEKNHLYSPNSNHKIIVPGGTSFEGIKQAPGAPQLIGSRANWLAMEVPFFEYHLKGIGKPFPKVTAVKTNDAHLARFNVTEPHPLIKTEVYWAKAYPGGAENDPELLRKAELEREWIALPATKIGEQTYEAKLPPDAVIWFALVTDERPVTVSSDLVHIP